MEKSKKRKTILIKLEIIVMMAIIIAGIVIMLMQFLPAKVTVKYLGFQPMVILTDSMTGVLDQGDVIVAKRANVEQLKSGDIISFNVDLNQDGEKEIVTHYVASVEKSGDGYKIRTKPNISNRLDTWELSEEDVIGELWFQVPKAGKVLANRNVRLIAGLAVSAVSFTLAGWIAFMKPVKKALQKKDKEKVVD